MRPIVDISNQRFGRLIALEPTSKRTRGTVVWMCKCDCGNTKLVPLSSLRGDGTRSCGCLHRGRPTLPPGEAALNQLYTIYKHSARRRDHEFNLSKEDFRLFTSEDCFYCGQEPSNVISIYASSGKYTYSGIDRLDNDKGYSIDNCVSCCKRCNYLKGRMHVDSFLGLIVKIYRRTREYHSGK